MTPRVHRSALGRATLFALLTGTPGCSLVFVRGAPEGAARYPPTVPVECTSSRWAPIVDTVFAGLGGLATTMAAVAPESAFEGGASRGTVLGLYGAQAALYAASAIHGYSSTAECRELQQQRTQLAPGATGPGAVPPPAPPPPALAPPPPPPPGTSPTVPPDMFGPAR